MFKAKVTLVKFDKRGYLKKLDKEMTETTKEAARGWLQVVTTIIPIWSRASIGTFKELADKVGYPLVLGAHISKKDRLPLGLSTGRGGLKLSDTSWHFYYETDLRYLAFNEFNTAKAGDVSGWFSTHRVGPGPYRFQDAGAAAFTSFAAQVKLPNPISFINPKRI